MSLTFTLTLSDTVTPFLNHLIKELDDLTELNKIIGIEASQGIRDYLLLVAPDRHATADRLGARHSGHLGKAARALEWNSDAEGATITLPAWTGLSRAFHDVEITPKNGKKWLTIPAHRRSYGRSARKFDDLVFIQFRKDLAGLFAKARSTGELIPMYWLKKKVKIKQDRSLLPSEEALTALVEEGAAEWLKVIISEKGELF